MAVYYHKKPIVTDGLIFQVDAANGKSYTSGSTTTIDMLHNTTGGTLTNGVGFSDGAWTFDGVNDYIDFGETNNATNDFYRNTVYGDTTTKEFTIEFWIKFESTARFNVYTIILSDGRAANASGWRLRIARYYGGVQGFPNESIWFEITSATGSNNGTTGGNTNAIRSSYKNGSTGGWADGNWHHVVCVKNVGTSSSDMKIYINGVNDSNNGSNNGVSTISALPTFSTNKPRLAIARGATNAGVVLGESKMSSLLLYNRALTDAEILQNYNSQKYRYI